MLQGHHQLLVVTAENWDAIQGKMQLYERESDAAHWTPIGTCIPVVLGRKGLAWGIGLHPIAENSTLQKKEGDGKSPAGMFALGPAFGFAPHMPHLKSVLSWLQKEKCPVLVQLPIQTYQILQSQWHLPEIN